MNSAVRLEMFGRAHLGVIDELAADADVQRFSRFPVPAPPDFAEIWWSRLVEGRSSRSRETFAVLDATDGRTLEIGRAHV